MTKRNHQADYEILNELRPLIVQAMELVMHQCDDDPRKLAERVWMKYDPEWLTRLIESAAIYILEHKEEFTPKLPIKW